MKVTQNPASGIIQVVTTQKNFQIIYIADAHLDHPKSKLKFMHRTLKKYPDAKIVIGGDSIDVMNFKEDRRGQKDDVREELQGSNYANLIIKFLRRELIEPYGHRIIAWNRGNHDNEVWGRMEIDLIDAALEGTGIPIGDFSGYIIVSHNKDGHARNNVLYYQHAPSSGGKRSKGMLSVDIIKGQAPDADVVLTEHIHQNWMTLQKVQKLDVRSKDYVNKYMWFVQNMSLKAEDEGRRNGYYHEKIKGGGTTQGMVVLSYSLNRNGAKNKLEVKPEIVPCLD